MYDIELPDLKGIISVDVECKDPDIKTKGPGWAFRNSGHVAGIAIIADNFKEYLPIGHGSGENMDPDRVSRWLKVQLSRKEQKKVVANWSYEMGWLDTLDVKFEGPVFDVLTAAPLIYEDLPGYSLDDISWVTLGRQKDDRSLWEAAGRYDLGKGKLTENKLKAGMWKFRPEEVEPYALEDAQLNLDVREKLIPIIIQQDLVQIIKLEHEIIPVTFDMRKKGVKVNLEKAEKAKETLNGKVGEILKEIKRLTGVEIETRNSAKKAAALETIGIKCPLTAKTKKPSVTKDFLQSIDHPVAQMMLQAAEFEKTANDFVQSYILDKHENGRIHCQFNSVKTDIGGETKGAGPGRFSSSTPNLQNLPGDRSPEMKKVVRELFEPDEGEEWLSVDYASQEPRLTVHYANILGVPGGPEAAAKYHENPRLDYHGMVAEWAGIPRKEAKIINLGIAYGMGEVKLCNDLGYPTAWAYRDEHRQEVIITQEQARELRAMGEKVYETAGPEGKELLRNYHEGAPFIKGMIKACTKKASRSGFITTILGRRCRFPKGNDGRFWFTHKALNRLIQGSAADQTKKAMVDCFKAGLNIKVTVHDELGFGITSRDQIPEIERIMKEAVPLSIPLEVDSEVGPSWGEAMLVSE